MPNAESPSSHRLSSMEQGTEEAARTHRVAGPNSGKIAVISDIHSNLHALEAVFTECTLRDIRHFFCLGDIVGYAAFPGECLSAVRMLKCPTVIGNHDASVAKGGASRTLNYMARAGVEYSVSHLSKTARDWLAALPEVIHEHDVTLVHASLVEPLEWDYVVTTGDAERAFSCQKSPVCFYGHTHIPKLFTQQGIPKAAAIGENRFQLNRTGRYLINPGSVGQPRGGGDPRAQFLVFDPSDFTVEFVRVDYDLNAAARAILDAGLPAMIANRLYEGL